MATRLQVEAIVQEARDCLAQMEGLLAHFVSLQHADEPMPPAEGTGSRGKGAKRARRSSEALSADDEDEDCLPPPRKRARRYGGFECRADELEHLRHCVQLKRRKVHGSPIIPFVGDLPTVSLHEFQLQGRPLRARVHRLSGKHCSLPLTYYWAVSLGNKTVFSGWYTSEELVEEVRAYVAAEVADAAEAREAAAAAISAE